MNRIYQKNIIYKIKALYKSVCLIGFSFLLSASGAAQVLSKSETDSLVNVVGQKLTDQYPFPEISGKYNDAILQKLAAGKYYNLSPVEFAKQLTSDLQAVHKDVHLRIYQDVPVAGNTNKTPSISSPGILKSNNYGFEGVELDRMTATAYVNVPGPMFPTQETFEMAANAMNLAAYSKYVIIDLRENPGGSGEIGRFLASYFYETGEEKYYLYGFHKDKAKDEQEWTYGYVPGKRNPEAKLYILTSRHTASAAEGMAYAMQKLNRATIVGDTTAGAGIAGSDFELKYELRMFLPVKMVVAPHTTEGWEGTGVIPDVETFKGDALLTAKNLILADILKTDSVASRKEAAQWLNEDKNVAVDQQKYVGFTGKYTNDIVITSSKSGYTWNMLTAGKVTQSFELKRLKRDVFTVVNFSADPRIYNTRIYVKRNDAGKIESLVMKGLRKDGSIRISPLNYKPV